MCAGRTVVESSCLDDAVVYSDSSRHRVMALFHPGMSATSSNGQAEPRAWSGMWAVEAMEQLRRGLQDGIDEAAYWERAAAGKEERARLQFRQMIDAAKRQSRLGQRTQQGDISEGRGSTSTRVPRRRTLSEVWTARIAEDIRQRREAHAYAQSLRRRAADHLNRRRDELWTSLKRQRLVAEVSSLVSYN